MTKSLAVALLFLCLSTPAFSQSSNGTISGTVSDPSSALIPGVTVTALNGATGIQTNSITNESGVYNMPGLLPGVYRVSAALPGFQTQTYTDVQLGNAAQVRLNFTLKVAGAATTVDVTIAADTLLATSSSSVGDVLSQRKVSDLPLVGNDVLDLILVMNGVEGITGNAFGQEGTTFAGVSAREINIQRDGISVNESRFPTGVRSATRLNPDLVGEIRLILAPVDVEMGRGNAQIQVSTRSGTNRYSGAAVWSVQNSALNANTWTNNRVQPTPTIPNWFNRHQYTLSFGGPIIRNKTFFYALWDGFISANKTSMNPVVLTPCARNGIFRYFDTGKTAVTNMWNNGNVNQAVLSTGNTPTIAVVDPSGNPQQPALNPDGTPFTGALRYFSVFGPLASNPTKPDCSDAVVQGNSWDPFRTKRDTTGNVTKLIDVMPQPNNYEVGDGLNTAGFRWRRTFHGTDNIFGLDETTERKQINIKVDHSFNDRHKANVSWSYERNNAPDYFMIWPDTTEGQTYRRPMVWTVNLTSTLSPSLVNEARFGYRVTGTNTLSPFDAAEFSEAARAFVPSANGFRVVPQLGQVPAQGQSGVNFQLGGYIGNRGAFPNTNQDVTPLWTYGDTVSWTKGKHSFKTGGEFRLSRSRSIADGFFGGQSAQTYARAIGGELTSTSAIQGFTTTNMPGLGGTSTTGNTARMRNLLTFQAGSLSSVNHRYFIASPNANQWDDFRTAPYIAHDWHQNEASVFFKDDWKILKNLTLNLGIRWDYYAVPYINEGITVGPVGGGGALFGISGRDYSGWMQPGPADGNPNTIDYDPNLVTQLQFVGKNSSNANTRLWAEDRNNFGPAVGFSWQLPWFGEGKTTVRGGFQITYQGGGRFYDLDTQGVANPPGSGYVAQYTGLNVATGIQKPYIDMNDALSIVPIPPLVAKPLETIPITDRSQALVAFDPNYVNPYAENFTLQVTRGLTRSLTLDVRYVGTMQLHGYRDINLNSSNFLYNGLKEAFDSVRSGGESALLDDMFRGLNIAGTGCQTSAGVAVTCGAVGSTPAGGVLQTAAMHMRASQTFNTNLANGNYNGVAGSLNTLVINQTNNLSVPGSVAGLNGAVLRFSGKFPENFISTNPQFSAATLKTNVGHTNYHSLQTQVTLRPVHGISSSATYTWQKNLGYGQSGTGGQGISGSAPSYTNPVERQLDYVLQNGDRRHELRMNGNFELPIGPNKLLFANSSGLLARFLERWETGWIINLTSGAPTSITGATTLYNNGLPDVVGPFNLRKGKVKWNVVDPATGQISGQYFPDNTFVSVPDPSCGTIAVQLRTICSNDALALVNPDGTTGQIVIQNAAPGTRGNLGQFTMEGPGSFLFNGNIKKSFQITESMSLQIRIDATNILNHPSPAAPSFGINNSTFGAITTKNGSRVFQGQARLTF